MNRRFITLKLWSAKGLAVLPLLSAALFSLGFNWGDFSLKGKQAPLIQIQTQWTADAIGKHELRPRLRHNIPPLPAGDLIIQGNRLNGVRAYNKNTGLLVWAFDIRPGAAGPLALLGDRLYFGSADGFFYSLHKGAGKLNWKFWTGSENSSAPLIHDNKIYWTSSNNKLYALSLSGKPLWVYSGPPGPSGFVTKGRPRPAIKGQLIYTGFHGTLFAINKDSGKLAFKKELSPSHSIVSDIEKHGACLFVPVFDFYLFCLRPSSASSLWQAKGGFSSSLKGRSAIYQYHKGILYALNKFNGKPIWRKTIEELPTPPVTFNNHLVYGFSSKGKLVFASPADGKTKREWVFGRGLSAPIALDPDDSSSFYLFSVDGILHKVTVAFKGENRAHQAQSGY